MIGDAVDKAADQVGERIEEYTTGLMGKVLLGLIAGLCVIGVVVCASIAAFWYLQPMYGSIWAMLGLAGTYAIIASIFVLASVFSSRRLSRVTSAIEPAKVVEEEGREMVDEAGPLKFIAAAFAGGALLGGLFGGARGEAAANTTSSLIGLAPTILSAMTLMTTQQAADDLSKASANESSV